MRFLALTVLLPALAIAADLKPLNRDPGNSLGKRQSSCGVGEKVCGLYCIYTTDTCCPDQEGGCPPTEYCAMGDNGVYGCCPDGEICTGDGGVTEYTTGTGYYSSYYTLTDDDSYTRSSSRGSTRTTSASPFEFTQDSDDDSDFASTTRSTRRSTSGPSATSDSSINGGGIHINADGLVGFAMGAAGLVGGLAIML